MNKKLICILGDVHGRYEFLQAKIINAKLDNCYIICVGDLGIGFQQTHEQELKSLENLNKFFAKRNITFMSIRGNHDDPEYFSTNTKLSHIELLPDYTSRVINDETFLFAGGAHSIDRHRRKLENDRWWADEPFVLKPDLVTQCDTLITHSAPIWLFPNKLENYMIHPADTTIVADCNQEKQDIDSLLKLCNAKKIYTGHFHTHITVDYTRYESNHKCYGRILPELGIVEHNQ